jgi:hypothetical protein
MATYIAIVRVEPERSRKDLITLKPFGTLRDHLSREELL